MRKGHALLLLLLSLIINAMSQCEIKAAYVKLSDLVIGKRSHEAMQYAIDDFNNGKMKDMFKLFPKLTDKYCKVSLAVYDAEATADGSKKAAKEMIDKFYSDKVTSPITLAMQYSGLTMAISDMVKEADLAQFSGLATNPALTEYSHFFRNIASDTVTTQAVVKLCNKMNWKNIGLFYMTSGEEYKNALVHYAKKSNPRVKVESFEFKDGADRASIKKAVKDMQDSGLNVFVLQAYEADLEVMIDEMRKIGMIAEDGKSEYTFIGYDGWLDPATINGNDKLRKYLSGTVGTCQSAFSEFEPIINVHPEFSQEYPSEASSLQDAAYETNNLISRHGDYVNDMLPYAYDQITTILLATEKYITKYDDGFLNADLESYINGIGRNVFTKRFMDILKSDDFGFYGITGDVSFDKKGDRENGLVAYCYFDAVKYQTIGFYLDGQADAIIDTNLISQCDIKAAYVKLSDLVIGNRSHEAMQYAIDDFNNGKMKDMDTLFPKLNANGCKVSLAVYDAEATADGSEKAAKEMIDNFYIDGITSPITLAMQYSGLSMAISDMVKKANLAQFSGFATNPALTEYSHFFRNIASDTIQTQALIKLCNKMNWKKIGLFHMESGEAFKKSLVHYAKKSNPKVKVESFEFKDEAKDRESIKRAVDKMKKSGLNVFVLQAYDADLEIMIDEMLKIGMIKDNGDWHPYTFIGYDGWLDPATIAGNDKLRKYLSGTVGTCQSAFSEFAPIIKVHPEFTSDYPSDASSLQAAAKETNNLIFRYGDYVNDMLPYAYDQITTILLATEKYITKYDDGFLNGDLNKYVDGIGGRNVFTERFMDILKDDIQFYGITGDVSFDKKGDRENGLVAYCNFRSNPDDGYASISAKFQTIGFYLDGQTDAIIDTNVILYNPSYLNTPMDEYPDDPDAPDAPDAPAQIDSSWLPTICVALLIFGIIFVRR